MFFFFPRANIRVAEVFFFPVLRLSLYKPGRKSTGKENPCNLAKPPKLTPIINHKRTNVHLGNAVLGPSLYNLVGNLPERKTLANQLLLHILLHRVLGLTIECLSIFYGVLRRNSTAPC